MPNSSKANPSGILMILSPAKTLDLNPLPVMGDNDNIPDVSHFTMPNCHPEKSRRVVKAMKTRSEAQLGKLLGVSSNLAKTSHEYWKNFAEEEPSEQGKPCIYAFSGAAYQGLQALECFQQAILYMQENLRIVDAVYGLLRPLDRIQPYRLEMATRNVFDGSDDDDDTKMKLNVFWKEAVTHQLSNSLAARPDDQPRILLNLASDEYAAAVDPTGLPGTARYVKVIFRDQGRVTALHAKRARGLMVRFLAERQAKTLEDVRQFDWEGYKLVADSDEDDDTIIFDRPKQAPPPKKQSTKRAAPKAAAALKEKEEQPQQKRGRKKRTS
jgi:uncharacterized protein